MSQQFCCVPGCTSSREYGATLHCFPNPRDPNQIERFRVWVMRIGGEIIGRDDFYIFKNRRICHNHFEEVFTFPNKRLTKLAVPSLHLIGACSAFPLLPTTSPLPEQMEITQQSTSTDLQYIEDQVQVVKPSTSQNPAIPAPVPRTPSKTMTKIKIYLNKEINMMNKLEKINKAIELTEKNNVNKEIINIEIINNKKEIMNLQYIPV